MGTVIYYGSGGFYAFTVDFIVSFPQVWPFPGI